MSERTYQVWSEGYRITGNWSGAIRHGEAIANSFAEACKAVLGNDKNFDEERMTYWGCRLFDNEADARKSYG